ncbi:CCR4-NOT transcription complex subunit 1 isoform X2 [Phlebotomus papatasi]|uniref:CCR4-NOT transcription complex subunit 1 isoform X2 n=1 Tax=Phlebotomus papatasi TaxID=29031 RepID=UPI0024837744|nr:CCR4-NOT transcription complex subunit 1 isoform X2 [Phlebotomus papatasi]
MNQDSLSFTLTQISYLVSTLNKKNCDKNSRQIDKLVEEFGLEADRHYLRCLFASIDFGDTQIAKHSIQAKLLCTNLLFLLGRPSFVSTICYTFENYLSSPSQKTLKLSPNFLNSVARTLSLSQIKEVAIAYSLLHSANPELAKYAEQHLKTCLPKFIQSYIEIDPSRPNQEGSLNDIAPELLQVIISVISHGKHSQFGLSDIIYNKFITHLCRDFPRDRVPLVLAPLLYAEETEIAADKVSTGNQGIVSSGIMDTSWANLVMDIGYAFTVTVEDCKNHLIKVTGREINPQDVAKILALMCRTHSNLSDSSINLPTPGAFWSSSGGQGGAGAGGSGAADSKEKVTGQPGAPSTDHVTWKPDIFVQALKEVVPSLSWKDVCVGLDHAEFVLKDRAGLNLLITTLRLGLQSMTPAQNFPAECLYRHWTNTEGQLSLITLILKNSDIFSFADYIFTSVSVELLKTPPETDNKEIMAWKSLHLVEVLLYIAENGFYTPVMELFKIPIQHCPDVLFMALLQINPPLTVLRQELFQTLIPIFLGNHPNSGAILHHAWNSASLSPSLRHIIMVSMSDWYLRGDNDQQRLSRILDVAQDLKALSNLLNVRSFHFVIDLACLASRREYLKLEKWLSDKIREHGEPFVQVMVKFLQRRCPQILGAKIIDDQIPKAAQLPHETLNTMMSCLHACVGNVQPELNEIIMTMNANCNNLLKMQQQRQPPPPNVLRQHRGIETPFNTSTLGGQIFTAPSVDSFASNMAGLNLGGPGNGAFNFGVLGNLMSTPASPSRLLTAPSNSPFSIMPMQTTPQVNMARIQPTPTGDKITMAPNTQQLFTDGTITVSKEAEDEANSYFQRIYNHPPHPTLSIDEVLDMLQRFQESRNRCENEVYTCMLRNLFEEYRFFPQYPDKELQITAQLFGGMIERNLVATYMSLGLALRCVFDALRKPEGSKMYYFGITALDRFKNKLHLYQKYCEHVRTIPHFDQFPPHLIEYVEYGANQQEPPNKSQALPSSLSQMMPVSSGGGTSTLYSRSSSVTSNLTTTPTAKTPNPTNPPSSSLTTSRVKSIANATNIDTLLCATQEREEKIITPPDAVQEKTAFIFNNLSQLNLQQKCEEIKDIMTKDYWPWLSQYLVLKRASIEVNFHVLYSNFLDALKIAEINRLVTKETFRNIRVLLRSDKSIANFSDRSLLKNLGHWLGMLTLGRNKPILHVDIDLKSLLMEAYHKGQQELLYVVPFVAKVLESCAKSKVFHPPNPWTMAIMNVLAELHQEPELKLNLKFEIEVLCKNFNIDVSELKAVVYLKDSEKAHKIEYQLSQPGKPKEPIQPIAPLHSSSNASVSDDSGPVPASAASTSSGNVTVSPNQSLDAQSTASGPPEPRFNYMEITVSNYSCINNLMTISPNILLLHTQPHLKALVRTAIERTLTDWMTPVVERSVKIATTTCEQIIRKDFALDGDENRMRTAAHYMIRNLSAGMAMITCREQLLLTITTNIKSAFNAAVTPQQKEIVDAAATQLASDNMELACAIIQKTTVEKAIPEIDKRLANDYEIRKVTRQEGRRYCDEAVYNYHCENMPKRIRLKIGGISSEQFAVYDEFARNIPGFQPITDQDLAHFLPTQTFQQDPISMSSFAAAPLPQQTVGSSQFSGSDFGTVYDDLGSKIESFLNSTMNIHQLQMQTTNLASLLDYLVQARRQRDNMSAVTLLNKAVEGLLDGFVNIPEHAEHIKIYRDIHLRVMRMMQDSRAFGVVATNRIITKYLFECREEIRYNLEAIDLLFSSNFINVPIFDIMLSQLMDNGNNYLAVVFGMQLIQHFFIEERQNTVLNESDFPNTIDLLTRISMHHHHRAPEGLAHVIDIVRLNQDPNNLLSIERMQNPHINSGIVQVRSTNEMDDPPGLISKTEYLLKDWVNIYHNQALNRDPIKIFGQFVNKMNIIGILKTDDLVTRFFRQATQLCIDVVYTNINEVTNIPTVGKSKCFQWIDAFVRLIAMLVKNSGDTVNATTKINLLNKVLGIVVGVLQQDQEVRGVAFQQLGYHRLFIMLFLELSNPEPVLENISLHTVTAFCHTYHLIRPSVAPGFCYSWLELISHRVFIGRVLAMIPQQKGWSMYSQLLMDLFKYLAPFLRNAELAKPVTLLYKGTLRVLLVLLHDFPEFLCDHHFGFCDAIPPNCIQMRNIILSAFPRNMRLPDPFTPNLKVDMLSEISTAPRIFTNYVANIQPATFKKDLDSYLKARAPVTFLSELRGHLQVSNEPGSRYNIPLMNALVLYVGNQAITLIRSKNLVPNMTTIVHSAHMDIFQNLAVDLDNEGRYLFLNAVANQLRYPNSHTHYFSCVLLYLFVEANSEAIQEQITRVLLERLIVNRPHPWGLLITFIELIKNPVYKFWDHDFVHCAPEIEKLFESVARSCMVVKANNQQTLNSVEAELQECN